MRETRQRAFADHGGVENLGHDQIRAQAGRKIGLRVDLKRGFGQHGDRVGEAVVGDDLARQFGHCRVALAGNHMARSEEHTSELQSLMRISYAVFCLKKNKLNINVKTYIYIKTLI